MKKSFYIVSVLYLLLPITVWADSGSVLRQYKDTSILTPGKSQPEKVEFEDNQEKAQERDRSVIKGTAVHIENINVVGNTTLTPDKLHQVLAPYTGRPLATEDIHSAANALMQATRANGSFVAKVYILPQDIVDNTITFNVIEGHLAKDGIVLGKTSDRVNDSVLLNQLAHTLKPGSVITSDKYERAIYLTNDLPGIKSTENLIFPAEQVGEAGFEFIPEDERLVAGNLYYDNFGSYYTGRNRWGATMELNSPSGHAEKITAAANISDYGTVYGNLDANLVLYPNGLRGGASFGYLDYKTEDTDNDLRGSALDGSVYLRYPIIRSRLTNLYSELHYTYSDLKDENDLSTITDRTLNVGSLQIFGDMSDSFFGGGVITARIEGYAGDVNLDDYQPFKEYDALYADTQGSFSRATLNLTRLQHLIGDLQAYLAFNGQIASGNMDPAQAISFGGPYDFPGYHAGEIFGDEGWMVHTDLRYNITSPPWKGDMQLSVFYDYGWIESHTVAIVDGFSVPGSVDNSYHLQSTGFGFSQTWEHFMLHAAIGWQLDNEIPDELLDDGGDNNYQGWVQLAYLF